MATLQFRGIELRAGSWKIGEDGLVYRHKFIGDLSVVAARGLGLEDIFFDGDSLKEFQGDFSSKDTRKITECTLIPNGMEQHKITFDATDLDFEVYSKSGKEEDDPADTRIRLTITSTDPFEQIEQYGNVAGSAKAILKVKLAADKQMKLTDTVAEEEAESEADDDQEPPPPAIKKAMKEKDEASKAARAMKKAAAEAQEESVN